MIIRRFRNALRITTFPSPFSKSFKQEKPQAPLYSSIASYSEVYKSHRSRGVTAYTPITQNELNGVMAGNEEVAGNEEIILDLIKKVNEDRLEEIEPASIREYKRIEEEYVVGEGELEFPESYRMSYSRSRSRSNSYSKSNRSRSNSYSKPNRSRSNSYSRPNHSRSRSNSYSRPNRSRSRSRSNSYSRSNQPYHSRSRSRSRSNSLSRSRSRNRRNSREFHSKSYNYYPNQRYSNSSRDHFRKCESYPHSDYRNNHRGGNYSPSF